MTIGSQAIEALERVVGAPWLDPRRVLDLLGVVQGATLEDTVITPRDPPDGKFHGVTLPAIRLTVADRDVYDPVTTAVRLLGALRAGYPAFAFRQSHFDRVAGGPRLRRSLEQAVPAEAVVAAWQPGLRAFRALREKYVLYPP